MTDLAFDWGRRFWGHAGDLLRRGDGPLIFLAVVLALALTFPSVRDVVLTALSDAYLSVSVFVALTLIIFYGLEEVFKVNLGEVLTRYRGWQVPIAAILGATPGCGAEILLVTQYTKGAVSFGAIVAALTATMGDSAFLLIAKDPPSAAIVIGLCTFAGMIAGTLVNHLHPQGLNFLKEEIDRVGACQGPLASDSRPNTITRITEKAWIVLIIPGTVIGVLDAVAIDVNTWFGHYAAYEPAKWIGVAGTLLALLMFVMRRGRNSHAGIDPRRTAGLPAVRRTIVDTNFVTFWVFAALIAYEMFALSTGGGAQVWLQGHQLMLPLLATLIGLIPGCGVMVIVTTLYLQHQIALSALISAAVSTDGDALFPAIALAPRSAILATLYTAFPALLMGYGWLLIME